MVRRFSRLVLIAVFLTACSGKPLLPAAVPTPLDLYDGLAVGELSDAGLDIVPISQVVGAIASGDYGQIHSMLVCVNGRLVIEEYFAGNDYQWDAPGHRGDWVAWDAHTRHIVHSVGKSITTACVGIAIEQGHITSVEDSVFAYLPDHQHLNTDGKDAIQIEHLLSMTSGLAWDEWGVSYANETNDIIGMWTADDPVAYILNKPIAAEPGAQFNYSGGGMVLLGEIVKNATGMDIEAFANEHLFAPMGVAPVRWSWINDTVIYAGGDQYLTPRDMCKFGALYLNGGAWDDERILPASWVERSVTPYHGPDSSWRNGPGRAIPSDDDAWGRRSYGYGWWCNNYYCGLRRVPVHSANGWAGQRIYVLPEQDAVAVFTAANYNQMDASVDIMRRYVIPALLH